MTLGCFAPLPPARTGVADYAAALLRALRPRVDVRVNAPGDVDLYHIGNNGLHRGIYRRALARPGVVILHDAVLHHLLLGALGEKAYLEEFVYNYGEWRRQLAGELWQGRARSAADARYFEYPMLRRLVERSRAVIVHNPAAASRVRRHAERVRVSEIPHLFEQPELPPAYEVIRLRAALGVPATSFICGVFGHLRESKRLWSVLRALEQVPGCRLLLAGEFASRDLERAITPALRQSRILRTGHLPERDFWLHACAVDACINLRYPSAGESSGIVVRLMGIGKPVVVTAGEETSAFPEDAVVRVDPGPAETSMLAHALAWLSQNPEKAREIGRRARAFIAGRHSPDRVAASVIEVVRQALPSQ